METKGKRGAGIRRTEPESRNSETQEWVLRTVYVRRGVEREELIKCLTVIHLILSKFCDNEWMNQQIRRNILATDGTRNEHGNGRRQRWGSAGASPYRVLRTVTMRIGKDGTARLPIAVVADDSARRRADLARGLEIGRCVAGSGPGTVIECEHLRLCSLMFAYIRLIGKNIESTACGQRCARPLSGMGNARKPQRTQRTQRRCVLDGVAEKRIEFSKVLDTWQLANFSL